jgi:hypothetical protein
VHSGIKAENELNNFTEIPFSHYSTKQWLDTELGLIIGVIEKL